MSSLPSSKGRAATCRPRRGPPAQLVVDLGVGVSGPESRSGGGGLGIVMHRSAPSSDLHPVLPHASLLSPLHSLLLTSLSSLFHPSITPSASLASAGVGVGTSCSTAQWPATR